MIWKIRRISDIEDNNFHAVTLDMTWDAGADGLKARLDALCQEAENAIASNHENIIILSDRGLSAQRGHSGLAGHSGGASSFDTHGSRTSAGLVIETGERARYTISAVWQAMGQKRLIPIWPLIRSIICAKNGLI